jgi:HrpA-like RNA helicase
VLALDLGDPYEFLRNAISPPEHQSISQAVLYLESLNAVSIVNVDTSSPETMMALNNTTDTDFDLASEITPLGYHLAALPISPRVGKLILYGVLLKCIDPILTIASTVSARSPFVVPFGEREAADAAKLTFLDGNSDLLSMLNVYQIWKDQFGGLANSGGGGRGRGKGGNAVSGGPSSQDEENFCRANFLSSSALRLIDQMRGQFLGLLQSIGFMPQEVTMDNIKRCEENSNGRNTGVVKCAICAGLSPSVLMIQPTNGRASSFPLSKSLQETVLLSRRRGMPMYVHPSSVLSNCCMLDSSYMVYMEGMKTSKMYARDVTTLLPLTLALFSGRLTCNERLGIVAVDGWIRFSATTDAIKCMMKVQEVIEDAFIAKVLDPSAPSSEQWNRVFSTVLGCIL